MMPKQPALYHGAKHIPFFLQRALHFHRSIRALFIANRQTKQLGQTLSGAPKR